MEVEKEHVAELARFVMEKADQHYSDDFPIADIETWIREYFENKNGE